MQCRAQYEVEFLFTVRQYVDWNKDSSNMCSVVTHGGLIALPTGHVNKKKLLRRVHNKTRGLNAQN